MSLPKSSVQMEHDKFVEDGSGDVAVRVKTSESALPSGAATSDKQDEVKAVLDNIETNTGNISSDQATEAKQDDIVDELQSLNSLIPSTYDYISLSYTSGNLTEAVFKTGGSGGSTVSTLTLAYDGDNNLTSVTKT